MSWLGTLKGTRHLPNLGLCHACVQTVVEDSEARGRVSLSLGVVPQERLLNKTLPPDTMQVLRQIGGAARQEAAGIIPSS